ncbi:hypothetical protein B0H14DRAFT_2560952 [Mycena olivaceomarginata]|nr:hypothetical protein B0H14DRAFT_2560952 [Mycena olivaceomarginata]
MAARDDARSDRGRESIGGEKYKAGEGRASVRPPPWTLLESDVDDGEVGAEKCQLSYDLLHASRHRIIPPPVDLSNYRRERAELGPTVLWVKVGNVDIGWQRALWRCPESTGPDRLFPPSTHLLTYQVRTSYFTITSFASKSVEIRKVRICRDAALDFHLLTHGNISDSVALVVYGAASSGGIHATLLNDGCDYIYSALRQKLVHWETELEGGVDWRRLGGTGRRGPTKRFRMLLGSGPVEQKWRSGRRLRSSEPFAAVVAIPSLLLGGRFSLPSARLVMIFALARSFPSHLAVPTEDSPSIAPRSSIWMIERHLFWSLHEEPLNINYFRLPTKSRYLDVCLSLSSSLHGFQCNVITINMNAFNTAGEDHLWHDETRATEQDRTMNGIRNLLSIRWFPSPNPDLNNQS